MRQKVTQSRPPCVRSSNNSLMIRTNFDPLKKITATRGFWSMTTFDLAMIGSIICGIVILGGGILLLYLLYKRAIKLEELKQRYKLMGTEALLKLREGTLTKVAQSIAEEELASRGVIRPPRYTAVDPYAPLQATIVEEQGKMRGSLSLITKLGVALCGGSLFVLWFSWGLDREFGTVILPAIKEWTGPNKQLLAREEGVTLYLLGKGVPSLGDEVTLRVRIHAAAVCRAVTRCCCRRWDNRIGRSFHKVE